MDARAITGTRLRAINRVSSAPVNTARAGTLRSANTVSGGEFRAHGMVTVSGTPAQRRVVLFDSATGPRPLQAIRATWSAADGSYSFERIADRPYFAIAFDHEGTYKSEIVDPVTLEPMP